MIYKCTCSCGENYIGETLKNGSVRSEEHNPTKMSEPHIYLKSYFYNVFNSMILCQASQNSLDVI